MDRVTVGGIAKATGLHENTIRRYSDKGYIEVKRDFLGRRFFPNPVQTITRIRQLLDGEVQLDEHS